MNAVVHVQLFYIATSVAPLLQNLSQDDSVALVFSLFENSLPVLPPTGVLQQHATPAAPSLEITLPFITQTAADRGLEMIAKVGPLFGHAIQSRQLGPLTAQTCAPSLEPYLLAFQV